MASISTKRTIRIAFGLSLLGLVVVAAGYDPCKNASSSCGLELHLSDIGCNWKSAQECVFKVIPQVMEKPNSICRRYEQYNKCWQKYEYEDCDMKKEQKMYDDIFKHICDTYKDDLEKALKCAKKDDTIKCVKEYRDNYGSKACNAAKTFSTCVSKVFTKHNCTVEAKKAFIFGYTKPLLKKNPKCEVKVTSSASTLASFVWSTLAAATTLIGLALF